MTTALIVIDVQNDFCAEGGMMHREGHDLSMVQAMVPRLQRLLDAARPAGAFVVFVKGLYNTEHNWYLSASWIEQGQRTSKGRFIDYPACPADGWGGKFYRVAPLPSEPVVVKHRYDGFEGTDLDLILRSHGIRTLIVTGVSTNVCVETTARRGFVMDYHIVLVEDCVATYDIEDHKATLRNIRRYFGRVESADSLIAAWQTAPLSRAERESSLHLPGVAG